MTVDSLKWFQTKLEALGADQVEADDALQLAYLEALSKRLSNARYANNKALLKTACRALKSYQSQHKSTHSLSRQLNQTSKNQTSSPFSDLLARIDASTATSNTHAASCTSLDDLLYEQEHLTKECGTLGNRKHANDNNEGNDKTDLHSMTIFKDQIKYMDVDYLIERAMNESPPNPGPHNPHMLSLKALTEFKQLSKQYTRRLALYIETMQWLEKNHNKLINGEIN